MEAHQHSEYVVSYTFSGWCTCLLLSAFLCESVLPSAWSMPITSSILPQVYLFMFAQQVVLRLVNAHTFCASFVLVLLPLCKSPLQVSSASLLSKSQLCWPRDCGLSWSSLANMMRPNGRSTWANSSSSRRSSLPRHFFSMALPGEIGQLGSHWHQQLAPFASSLRMCG